MSKKYLVPAGIALICIAAVSVGYVQRNRVPQDGGTSQTGSLTIVSTIYPLTFFTQQIVGNLANVTTITPAGAEPHEYEPTSQDIALLESADVVILNGANLEPWIEKIINPLRVKGIQVVIASAGIANRTLVEDGEEIQDPHVWLSPVLAKTASQKISQSLQQADPLHAATYQENEKKLRERLDQLDQAYTSGLASCQNKNIVTSHAAFAYLAAQYGLRQVSIAGLSPETEPSGRQLVEIARFVKEQGIKVIFFETLISPKLSQTIARETGATVMELNPLEGLTPDEVAAGKDYTSVMQNNLHNLQTALVCHQ